MASIAQRSRSLTGGCLCGAVRYEAVGEALNTRICHCRFCQLATGAPYFARALFPRAAVTITGRTDAYPTSPRIMRLFCPSCGTRLFAEPTDLPARIGVALATLDEPNRLAPECHIFVSRKLAWVVIGDDLPQYPERPPA
jgi:hypothetical protein